MAHHVDGSVELGIGDLTIVLVERLGVGDQDFGIADDHLIDGLLVGGVPLFEHESFLQAVAIAMLVAEGVVASLVGFLVLLVEGHGHTWVAVDEHVVVVMLLDLEGGLLAGQTVGVENLVDGLTSYADSILHATGVVVGDDSTVAIGAIDLDEHVLLVLAAFAIEVEEFLEVGIEVVLAALDETLGSIDAHLQVALVVTSQVVVLREGALVESDAYQHTHGCTLRNTSPIGSTAHLVDVGQILFGKLQVGVALLNHLFAGSACHLDVGIARRVEGLEDEGHIAVFLHKVEEVEGTEEVGFGQPAVLLGIGEGSTAALLDDVVAHEDLLIGVGPFARGGRDAPTAARSGIGCCTDDVVGTGIVREALKIDIQLVAGTTQVGLTLPEGVVGKGGLRQTVQFATGERHHAAYDAGCIY